jgi:protein TonB
MAATANANFKQKYRKYFDIAMAISLGIHLLAFAVVPTININPYKTQVDELEVIEIPPEIEIPPPPKEIARPKIPVETLDEEVEEEETIEDTTLDMDNLPDAPPPPPPGGGDWLVFDKAPKPKKIVKPDYPVMARQAEMEGVVVLKVTVDEKGRVIRVVVLRSDADVFDQPAIDAVKKWIFTPAEQSGNPVKATITVPLSFTLNR